MTIKRLSALTLCLGITCLSYATNKKVQHDFIGNIYNYIENLDVFEYGQEESRAYYIPENSMTTLCGEWDFKYFSSFEDLYNIEIDDKSLYEDNMRVEVPKCFQLYDIGVFDKPLYSRHHIVLGQAIVSNLA